MHLYHVTYYARIPAIAKQGLRPNAPRSIGGPAYDSHSRGKVFLTVREVGSTSDEYGLPFWFNRAVDFANANFDYPVDAGAVPVVLRVPFPLPGGLVHVDPHGKRDARARAFFVRRTIPAALIDVWTGRFWQPIERAEMEPVETGAEWSPPQDEDDYGYWHLLNAYSNPRSPFYPR